MATSSTNQDQINISRIAGPISRCVVIIIILATSTGILIRRLITITLYELAAFTVGSLWLGIDLILSLGIILLIHDILILGKVDNDTKLVIRGKTLLLNDIIIILFGCLYIIDILLVLNCSVGKHPTQDCEAAISYYRQIFFHIQLYISVIYLLKPWKWSKIDLQKMIDQLASIIKPVNSAPTRVCGHSSRSTTRTRPTTSSTPRSRPTTKSTTRPTTKSTTRPTSKSATRPTMKSTTRPTTRTRGRGSTRPRARPRTSSVRRVTGNYRRPAVKIFQQSGNRVRVEVVQ